MNSTTVKKGKEKGIDEIKDARERAMKDSVALKSKTGSNNRTDKFIKNFANDSDFKTGVDYYVALLNLTPICGGAHWFSADGDVSTTTNKKFSLPRNCSANLLDDLSYGDNPEVCPACWLGKYETEYFGENNEFPEGFIPVDVFKGKPTRPTLLIYYYALIGELVQVIREKEKPDGTIEEVTSGKIMWWDEPVVLQIKPSINTIITTHLNNDEEYGGDIRKYVWIFNKKEGMTFDKYSGVGPMRKNGALYPVNETFTEKRQEYINMLPTAKTLLKPVSPDEMADLLSIPDWKSMKESGVISASKKGKVAAESKKNTVNTSVKKDSEIPINEKFEESFNDSIEEEDDELPMDELNLDDFEDITIN